MAKPTQIGNTTFSTPSDRELVATRIVDAPRQLVWEASTRPEHLRRWLLGPDGWTMHICDVDLRPGGAWRYGWKKTDGTTMEMNGIHRDVLPPERLAQTESWGGSWPETLNTLVLTEAGDKTILTTTVLYPSKEAREAATATGMLEGWSQSYDRLDEYLRTLTSSAEAPPPGPCVELPEPESRRRRPASGSTRARRTHCVLQLTDRLS